MNTKKSGSLARGNAELSAAVLHKEFLDFFQNTIQQLHTYIQHRTRIPEITDDLVLRVYQSILRRGTFLRWKNEITIFVLFRIADSVIKSSRKWQENAIGYAYIKVLKECFSKSEDIYENKLRSFIYAIKSLPSYQQKIAVLSLFLKWDAKKASEFLKKDVYFVKKEYRIVQQALERKLGKSNGFNRENPQVFLQSIESPGVSLETIISIREALITKATGFRIKALHYLMPAASSIVFMSTFMGCVFIVSAYFITPLSAQSSLRQIAAVDTILYQNQKELKDDLDLLEKNIVGKASHYAQKDIAMTAFGFMPYAVEKQMEQSRTVADILGKMGYKSKTLTSKREKYVLYTPDILSIQKTYAQIPSSISEILTETDCTNSIDDDDDNDVDCADSDCENDPACIGAYCGDAYCNSDETCYDCEIDCGSCCGDGSCNYYETCDSCKIDCGACTDPYCGDEICNGTENCSNCEQDCGVCPPSCGDGECNGYETCSSCEQDCGVCPPSCGDGECNGDETCSICTADCGACPVSCGNGTCDENETCSNCSQDCESCGCDGNNYCNDETEICWSCQSDCGSCSGDLKCGKLIPYNIWRNKDNRRELNFSQMPGFVLTDTAIALNKGFSLTPSHENIRIVSSTPSSRKIPSSSHQINLSSNKWMTIRFVPLKSTNSKRECSAKAFALRLGTPDPANRVILHYTDGTSEEFSANADAEFIGKDTDTNPNNNFYVCEDDESCPYRDDWFMALRCDSREIASVVIQANDNWFEHADYAYIPGESCDSCPDGECSDSENCDSCSVDCGTCENENSCGDYVCGSNESCSSCPGDCGICPCGDGSCNGNETCTSCTEDCGVCSVVCGDGECNAAGGESRESCPYDCHEDDDALDQCGDGMCTITETCVSCEEDCGTCPVICGDGACLSGESCTSCPIDCGACLAYCGDAVCNGTEGCENCSDDCGYCPVECGDDFCEGNEPYTCPEDCPNIRPPDSGGVSGFSPTSSSPNEATPAQIREVLSNISAFTQQYPQYALPEGRQKLLENLLSKIEFTIIDRYRLVGLLNEFANIDYAKLISTLDDVYEVLLNSNQLSFESGSQGGWISVLKRSLKAYAAEHEISDDAMNKALRAARDGDIEQLMTLLPNPEKSLEELNKDLEEFGKIFDDKITEDMKKNPKNPFRKIRQYQEYAKEQAINPDSADLTIEQKIDSLIARNNALSEIIGISPASVQKNLNTVREQSSGSDAKRLLSVLGIVRFLKSTAGFDDLEERMEVSVDQMRSSSSEIQAFFSKSVAPGAEAAEILRSNGISDEEIAALDSTDFAKISEIIMDSIVDRNSENNMLMRLTPEQRKPHSKRRNERDTAFKNAILLDDLHTAVALHGAFVKELQEDIRENAFIVMRFIYRIQDWFGIS